MFISGGLGNNIIFIILLWEFFSYFCFKYLPRVNKWDRGKTRRASTRKTRLFARGFLFWWCSPFVEVQPLIFFQLLSQWASRASPRNRSWIKSSGICFAILEEPHKNGMVLFWWNELDSPIAMVEVITRWRCVRCGRERDRELAHMHITIQCNQLTGCNSNARWNSNVVTVN